MQQLLKFINQRLHSFSGRSLKLVKDINHPKDTHARCETKGQKIESLRDVHIYRKSKNVWTGRLTRSRRDSRS